MSGELTAEQNLKLLQMEAVEPNLDEWQDLCRAVIVRAIMDYATYGYNGDSKKEQSIHDDAKYWIFTDTTDIVTYVTGASVSISTVRSAAKKLRRMVVSGEFKVQRDIDDTRVVGQLDMFDLWGGIDG